MANTASARKNIRQNERRRAHNQQRLSQIRTCRNRLNSLLEERLEARRSRQLLDTLESEQATYEFLLSSSDRETAPEVLANLYSLLDKAAKTKVIKKNTANRGKSRAIKLLKKALGEDRPIELMEDKLSDWTKIENLSLLKWMPSLNIETNAVREGRTVKGEIKILPFPEEKAALWRKYLGEKTAVPCTATITLHGYGKLTEHQSEALSMRKVINRRGGNEPWILLYNLNMNLDGQSGRSINLTFSLDENYHTFLHVAEQEGACALADVVFRDTVGHRIGMQRLIMSEKHVSVGLGAQPTQR